MFDFYLSAESEKNKLMDMFCTRSVGFSREKRAAQYHFPVEMAHKMYQHPRYIWDAELERFLAESYRQNQQKMTEALSFYQNYWQENHDKYFIPLERFFQFQFPVYRVLLAHFLDAISNWNEPNIVLNAYDYQSQNPLYHVYAVLYETVLSQIFIRVRQTISDSRLSDTGLWAMAELSSMAILYKLFAEFSSKDKTGYPQIDSYATQFIEIAQHTDSYESFLEQALPLVLSSSFYKG